jgi:DNA-binding NtrC family response regulator
MSDLTARDETSQFDPIEKAGEAFATLQELERSHIERVLGEVRWNQRRAAQILGITRWSLGRRLRKYGMRRHGREKAPATAA